MFTGLVAKTGTMAALRPAGPGRELGARLTIRARFADGPLALGESIAVNGVCLTVDSIAAGEDEDEFEVDASAETLARTTLGALGAGSPLHLERALRAADRMGGHLVTGHVDGVGTLADRRSVGDAVWMAFRVPDDLAKFIAEKGSIAVDGVSLTVNAVEGDRFEVTLIPHTLERTTLGALAPGGRVNLEVDLIARYVARLLSTGSAPPPSAPPRG
jgi:riboflavin synthase